MFYCGLLASAITALVACGAPAKTVLPGHTEIAVESVTVVARAGETLTVDYGELYKRLGVSTGGPLPTFNPFQLAEDRGRVVSYLQNLGYFDAAVDEPVVTELAEPPRVTVRWPVHEGPRYIIASVDVVGAPAGFADRLRALVPFGPGDAVDLATYRAVRHALSDRLREAGYGRAVGYSRSFLDPRRRTVAWFFYVDPGPLTTIGAITVEGSRRVPADVVLAQSGLVPGRPYSTVERRRAELAVLDTGSFTSASVLADSDPLTPPDVPDNGGIMPPGQLDAAGRFVPRTWPAVVAVRLVVVEAPARQLRAELGVEADPSRLDAYTGAQVVLRDVVGPLHHMLVEGAAGYGWFTDDDDPVRGFYGSALVQYQRPGFLARRLELRLSARWRDALYPSALLRELTAGPGLRSTPVPGVFVEAELHYRLGRQLGMPALAAGADPHLALPDDDDSRGAELTAAAVIDRRNDRVEPTRGWMVAARAAYSPGGPLGDHRWLQLDSEVRGFVPITRAWSIAARVGGGGVGWANDAGIPLGPRLFGGGAFGMRGRARDHLSPVACAEGAAACEVLVGGRSRFEGSVEARYLPVFGVYGGAAFVDAGGAGAAFDPFADGLDLAAGAGLRLRSWYLPIAIDVSYRLLDHGELGAGLDRLLAFVRVGEAF
jgi:outer membrane translocation and assembly module TamA